MLYKPKETTLPKKELNQDLAFVSRFFIIIIILGETKRKPSDLLINKFPFCNCLLLQTKT